jgi:hypothetical protein
VRVICASGATISGSTELYVARATTLTSAGDGRWLIDEVQTGWIDLQGSVSEGNAAAALTVQVYQAAGPWRGFFMRRDQPDQLDYTLQMPHQWDCRTPVRPHLHFAGCGPDAGTFAVEGVWTWWVIGEALSPATAWTSYSASIALATTDQYVSHALPLFTATPPAGATPSAFLLFAIQRVYASTDTYHGDNPIGTAAANVLVKGVDAHVWGTRPGTREEFGGSAP